MSIEFTAASSQRITTTSAPSALVMPFTVGMWVYPRTTGTLRYYWWAGQSGAVNNFWAFGQTTLGRWTIDAQNTTLRSGVTSGTMVGNRWQFVIARFRAAGDRSMDAMEYGALNSASSGSLVTPTSNTMALGANAGSTPASFFDGFIGEFWWVNRDILPSVAANGALPNDLFFKIAFEGPFSVMNYIGGPPLEYRSLFVNEYEQVDVFYNGNVQRIWTNTGGAKPAAPHPPLPCTYAKPGQRKSLLMI